MMESYAVFEGGGVKGVAFAGALKAAEESKIKFVGYGGASAGSIVAFLATLGFSSDEVKTKLQELHFTSLLDSPESFEHLQEFLVAISKYNNLIVRLFSFIFFILWNPLKFLIILWTISKVFRHKGAYNTDKVSELMFTYAKEKLGDKISKDAFNKGLSFRKLHSLTQIDFRVIATDVLTGQAIEFAHDVTPDICVFKAITASSAYPLVFRPSQISKYSLVDGGLSCNLPTYLFHGPQRKKLPIYAFDLIKDSDGSPVSESKTQSFFWHLFGLLNSALDASNNIISQVVGGIAVPVNVPNDIKTLDFNISKSNIDRLFDSGYKSSIKFFESHRLTKLLKKVKTEKDIAVLLYGEFDFVLNLLIESLPDEDIPVKAWLYTSVNADCKEIISFSKASNSDDETPNDHKFQLDIENNDCVRSWNNIEALWSYDSAKNKTRICFPITSSFPLNIDQDNSQYHEDKEVLALLCVSMDKHFEKCQWLEAINYVLETPDNIDISGDMVSILHPFCYNIYSSMLGNQASFHQSNGV